MKKSIMFGLVMLLLLMLVGCDEYTDNITSEELSAITQNQMSNPSGLQVVYAPTGITMNISSYTASGLTFYFENLTEYEFIYGEDFVLYALVNNAWERVEPTIVGYWGFTSIGYDIPPNSATNERTVDWVWLFGELPNGKYRFQKDILYVRQPGDFDRFVLKGDFLLSDSATRVIVISDGYDQRVRVITDGNEHDAFRHWNHGFSPEENASGWFKIANEVADELTPFLLNDDFHIIIEGELWRCRDSYVLFFYKLNDDEWLKVLAVYNRPDGQVVYLTHGETWDYDYWEVVTIHDFWELLQPGEYILDVSAWWGNNESADSFNNFFRFIK